MRREAAEAIAGKIREVWGGQGPMPSAWVEELADRDEAIARAALNDLKRTVDRCPSIARFFAAYAEARRDQRGDPDPCDACDGAGWLEAEPRIEHDHAYSQVRPCLSCSGSGKRAEQRGAA